MEPVFRNRLWRPPSSEASRALVAAATADVTAAAAQKIALSAERRRWREAYPLVADSHDVEARSAQKAGKEVLAYRQRMFARGSRYSAEMQTVVSASGRREDATDLETKLEQLVAQHDVMLFMKGTPDKPGCGLSARAVAVLKEAQVEFDSVDVLRQEDVRQGLKALSDYPTYPQLYRRGKFVGGLAAIQRLRASGDLIGALDISSDPRASFDTGQPSLGDAASSERSPQRQRRTQRVGRDETMPAVRLTIVGEGKLGLSLGPSVDDGESMLQVKSVAPDGLAAAALAGREGIVGLVLSEVMGQPTAGMDHRAVLLRIKSGPRPMSLVFTSAPVLSKSTSLPTSPHPMDVLSISSHSSSITWGKCGHMFYTDAIKRWIAMNVGDGTESYMHQTCPFCSQPWELDKTEQLTGAELQRTRGKMTDLAHAEWARRRHHGGSTQLALASTGDDTIDAGDEYQRRNSMRQKGKNIEKHLLRINHVSDKRREDMIRRRGKPTATREADSSSPFQNAGGPADGLAGLSIAYRNRIREQVSDQRQAASLESGDLEFIQGVAPQVEGGSPCLTVAFSSHGPSWVLSNQPDLATGKVGPDKIQAGGLKQIFERWAPFGLQVRMHL